MDNSKHNGDAAATIGGNRSTDEPSSGVLAGGADVSLSKAELAAFFFTGTHSGSLGIDGGDHHAQTSSAMAPHISQDHSVATAGGSPRANNPALEQQAASFTVAVSKSMKSPLAQAVEATGSRQHRDGALSLPSPLSWPITRPENPLAASQVDYAADGSPPIPSASKVRATAGEIVLRASSTSAISSSETAFGLANTTAPTAAVVEETAFTGIEAGPAAALFPIPSDTNVCPKLLLVPPAQTAASGSPTGGRTAEAAPVRIAILPPETRKEGGGITHALLSSGASHHSPNSIGSPAAGVASPSRDATRSPGAARPLALTTEEGSPGNSGAAASYQAPSRCYSLFPPPSTKGTSAQLSPAQTTMSRTPISNRSPGALTPQQQENLHEQQQQQQQELWQDQQQESPEPLLVTQLLQQQQQPPNALQHSINTASPTGLPADDSPVGACGTENEEPPEEDQQLQQQLQQLHHRLLAQLSASSATAVTEAQVVYTTDTTAQTVSFSRGAAPVADDENSPTAAGVAGVTKITQYGCGGNAVASSTIVEGQIGLKGKKDSLEKQEDEQTGDPYGGLQQHQQQRTNGSNSSAAVAACAAVAIVGAADAVTASSAATGVSVVASAPLFSRLDSTPQARQHELELQRAQGQERQQEKEELRRQDEYFPATLFRSLSAASISAEGLVCSGEAAGSNSSTDIIGSSSSNFNSNINISCEVRTNTVTTSGCSGTTTSVAEREEIARTRATAQCGGSSRSVTFSQHAEQQGPRQNAKAIRRRVDKKHHTVTGDWLRGTAHVATADSRKERGVDAMASGYRGGHGVRNSNVSGCGYSGSPGRRTNYADDRILRGGDSSRGSAHAFTTERYRNSRNYADFGTLPDSPHSGLSRFARDNKREDRFQEEGHHSINVGGRVSISGAVLTEGTSHQEQRNSAAATDEQGRAALRAALLARQDCLQRFLQATQQALSALEGDNSEKQMSPGGLLCTAGSPPSVQGLNEGRSCSIASTGASGCYNTPGPSGVSLRPNHPPLHGTFVAKRSGELLPQRKLVNHPQQVQGIEGHSRTSHFSAAALPFGGTALLPPLPPTCPTSSPAPAPLGTTTGAATSRVVAEVAAAAVATEKETAGECRLLEENSDKGTEGTEAIVDPSSNNKSHAGGALGSGGGGSAFNLPPRDTEGGRGAAAAAAAAAAKAMVAAAASFREQHRQHTPQQQRSPQQHRQQQLHQRRQHQHEPVPPQNREQQCAPTLRSSIMSDKGETEAEPTQLLPSVVHLPCTQADEGSTVAGCMPSHALDSDNSPDTASDEASPAPSAFSGRGGTRARTAPASSFYDRTMRGFFSFLCGGHYGDYATTDAEAVSLLRRHGETILRAAHTPYTPNTGTTAITAAAAGEALAALLLPGEAPTISLAASERRERPRVRFREQRSQQHHPHGRKGDTEEDHAHHKGGPRHELAQQQQQQRRTTEHRHQDQHEMLPKQQQRLSQAQEQQVVCTMQSNTARMQLRRMLQMQQCHESETASLPTTSPTSSPSPRRTPHDAFLSAVAAAAAAAAEDCERSAVTSLTSKNYANTVPGTGAIYENDNQLEKKTLFETDMNSPLQGISSLLTAGEPSWSESLATPHIGMVTSTAMTPWSAVPVPPPDVQQDQRQQQAHQQQPHQQQPHQQQQQQGENLRLAAISATTGIRPALHVRRLDGVAVSASVGQEQQHRHMGTATNLFMRPQRRTATLPCTAANVLFQSMDMQALLHLQCRCKPCAFYYNRKGCRNGTSCEFCHHEDHSRLTVKQWKKQQHKLCRQCAVVITPSSSTQPIRTCCLYVQARCLSLEEERAVASYTASIGARNSASGGSLYGDAGRQIVGISPTPRDGRDAASPMAIPLIWKDDDSGSSSSSCGSALLLRSGECSSRSNCTTSPQGTSSETPSNSRFGGRTGTEAHNMSPSGHAFEQSRLQLENSFQADDGYPNTVGRRPDRCSGKC